MSMPPPPPPPVGKRRSQQPTRKINQCNKLRSRAFSIIGILKDKAPIATNEEKRYFDFVKDGLIIDPTSASSIMTKIMGQRRTLPQNQMTQLLRETQRNARTRAQLDLVIADINELTQNKDLLESCSDATLTEMQELLDNADASIKTYVEDIHEFIRKWRHIRDQQPIRTGTTGDEAPKAEGLAWMCKILNELAKKKNRTSFTLDEVINFASANYPHRFGGFTREIVPSLKAVSPQELTQRREKSLIRPNVAAFLKKFGSAIKDICNVEITGI